MLKPDQFVTGKEALLSLSAFPKLFHSQFFNHTYMSSTAVTAKDNICCNNAISCNIQNKLTSTIMKQLW